MSRVEYTLSAVIVCGRVVVFDKIMFQSRICLAIVILLTAILPARAGEVTVAVAANFASAANTIVHDFEEASLHRVVLVVGSTGKLAAQIMHGAPYDVLLAADRQRPALLEKKGLTVRGSRFSYARGQLIVWSTTLKPFPGDLQTALSHPSVRHVAIANERLAPYGRAARQVLDKVGVDLDHAQSIIVGESVGQVFGMVASGNAQLGFIAMSQLKAIGKVPAQAYISVPPELYDPILQDGVLLARAAGNPAARAFIAFMQTPQTRQAILQHGYGAAQ